jgi:hypothetical protein
MSMYKQASRLKLRFQTSKGPLTTEQLWDLSISELDKLAVFLEKDYEKSDGKSFVRKSSEKDKVAKLRFDLVLDVLNTKMEEDEAARNASDTKAHNERILALIAKKKESALESLTVEELEKQLK